MSDTGGRRGAQSHVQEHLEDDYWIPLDSGKVREDSTARYVPFPQPHARQNDLDQGTDVDYRYHPSGALLVLPPDTDEEDVFGDTD